MASVGPLLLLMMLSSIFISTVIVSTSADDKQGENPSVEKLKKAKGKIIAVLKSGAENAEEIKSVVTSCLSVIQDAGSLIKDLAVEGSAVWDITKSLVGVVPVIGSVFSLAMTIVSVIMKHVNDESLLKDLKEEFDKIDSKLDKHYKELKWDIWAAGVYHKPELKIRNAWTEYKTLLGSLAGAKDDAERKRHEEHFMEAYLKYKDATKTLNELLQKKGTTFINNLGDDLAKHVNCHEKEIIDYTVLILTLIYKGNMMNQHYYELKNIESGARADELTNTIYNAESAMFEIHKQCISNSMTYVEQDVKPLIDKTKKRDDLAKEVWTFLKKTYDRYDWMVVAFLKKGSSYKIKTLNKHVWSGFTEVSTERITVAVARQVKGTHTKVKEVSEAIKKCISDKVLCYTVAETLSKCGEKVAGIQVSQTYTAVHAYTRKAHQQPNTNKANPKAEAEAEDEDDVNAAPENSSAETPYIYTGTCEKSPLVKGGKFAVLIKSDEEMMGKNPCSNLKCGQGGTCEKVKGIFLAVCQCKYPYYGWHCENDIKDYRTELEKEARTHAESYNRKSENKKKVKVKTD